jgi:hypothetical protein
MQLSDIQGVAEGVLRKLLGARLTLCNHFWLMTSVSISRVVVSP